METIKEFFDKYGTDTTNNFQLEKYAEELKINNFHCIMRNELREIAVETNITPFTVMSIIINLHNSNQKGVHWSMIFVSKNNGYFFDSFGLPPPEEVIKFLKPLQNRLCSTFKLQEFDQKYCGIISLFVLYKLNKGLKFTDIILDIKKQLNFIS